MKKKFLSTALALASSTLVWGTMTNFDNYSSNTNVTNRYYDGTIQADVKRVQTSKFTGLLFKRGYERNMKAIKRHAECVTNPAGCKST